jgi:hypothetical protein
LRACAAAAFALPLDVACFIRDPQGGEVGAADASQATVLSNSLTEFVLMSEYSFDIFTMILMTLTRICLLDRWILMPNDLRIALIPEEVNV